MATVSELKEKAREYEQQGQVAQALKIYQHVLKHFEGSPNLIKVLPLYVKVGDLHLRDGRTDAAVSAYETAAKEYAIHGAAQRVDALCSKIERVDPNRADAHARLAQKLIDHGHAGSARDILAAYAEKEGLTEIQETLDDLAGRPMTEVEPLLIKLLASWGEGAAAPSEHEAARLSNQIQQVTDQEAGELAPEPEHAHSPVDPDEPALLDDVAEPAPEESSPTLATVSPVVEPVEAHPAPLPSREARGPSAETRPRIAVLEPESSAPEPAARGGKSGLGLPAVFAIFAGALGAGFFGGRFTAPPQEPAPVQVGAQPDTAPPLAQPPVPIDFTATDPTAADSTAIDPTTATDTDPDLIDPPETTNPPPAETPPERDVIDPPGTTNPPPAETPPAVTTGPTAVVVDGLEILGIFDIEFRGQAGYRVVHRLDDSGARLVIESYPATTGTGTGRVTVQVTPPDTVVGILRTETHMVYASGVMPEDSLRSLMTRLVVQPQN